MTFCEKEINRICLEEIQHLLDLDSLPLRIEAYDISNIQGVDSVGSMIVFEDGKAKNSDYRRFRIKTVKNANDYDSMREILERRFTHGLKEIKEIQERKLEFSGGKFSNFPDFIMMDSYGRIHIFETKSLNKSSSMNFDTNDYEDKVNALKKCYEAASKLVDYYFYIPVLENSKWQIHKMHNGSYELISLNTFKELLLNK